MKKVLFLILAISLIACGQNKDKNPQKKDVPSDSLVQKYENEYFSVMYPQGWTAEWEDLDANDERLNFVLDSLNVKGGHVYLSPDDNHCGVKITKSSFAWIVPNGTPKKWIEFSLSTQLKEGADIYPDEITDSLTFDGYPAARVEYAQIEQTDTVIQVMYAIVRREAELYYATGKFLLGDDKSYELCEKIISTVRFK